MPNYPESILNIASTIIGTNMLGPGLRSVVWVMGCMLNCPGCIAPEWIPLAPNRLVSPKVLADELLSNSDVTGITISGGEPMLQSTGLVALIHEIRKIRDVNIICYTGYTMEHILTHPPSLGIKMLLKELDVLIDGPYIQKLNDNKGMRGSSNQRIIFLTDKLINVDFENHPRAAELVIQNGYLHLVGVPDIQLKNALDEFTTIPQINATRSFSNVRS